MRILVTGATGYLGGHFCEYLKSQNHEVVGFIRNQKKAGLLDKLEIKYEIGDLLNKETIIVALEPKYDIIVNSAGYINDRGPLKEFRKLNVETTQNLVEAMIETGHKRLIHISSVAAYGDFGLNITEEYQPRKHKWFKYGLTKLESEEVLQDYELDYTILRPPHIVGERDRTGFIPVLYHSFRKSGTWIENGKSLIPVVYVKDVCHALEVVIQNEQSINEIYNVSSHDEITIKETVDILHEILGLNIPEKSYSYRYANFIARVSEFFANFGINPALTRLGVIFGSKDASFPSDKLQKLGWKPTKSAIDMISEWATWRKEFEQSRK